MCFHPISISTELKDSGLSSVPPIFEPTEFTIDPDAQGRFILSLRNKWKTSCNGIESAEIVKFLGLPVKSTDWGAVRGTKPTGFGQASGANKICRTQWADGHMSWDSCLMIQIVNDMPKAERTIALINRPQPVTQKKRQKNPTHGQGGQK